LKEGERWLRKEGRSGDGNGNPGEGTGGWSKSGRRGCTRQVGIEEEDERREKGGYGRDEKKYKGEGGWWGWGAKVEGVW